ncbi:hypothetical protein ABIA33_006946 [Streptacidiphilus sp. MAP12-16]
MSAVLAMMWTASVATIDWYCCPRFDAPSVFASILDADRGGAFELTVDTSASTRQFYVPDTNVLITRFFSMDGVAEVQDFMPIVDEASEADRHRLIRRVSCVRGALPFRARVAPRFGYGAESHTVMLEDPRAAVFRAVRSLGSAGSRHLGDPGRPSGFRVFAADVLGRTAARDPDGEPARSAR